MEHKGTQRIETERLILRRFTTDDAEAMATARIQLGNALEEALKNK